MWFEDYQWHYDYVRLAWDTGFSFDKCKSPNLDKNKICLVDVDKIVKERDVASVDRYISLVVQYILDDEQAKVLDTNFVKIFRISQLAVEYLLFCKKYLDNTVTLLKKELTRNREENKELKLFVEDLQGHVETLTKQQVFASFKCSLCSKVFGSEDYLNAHIKRRHNIHSHDNPNLEADKLNMEIKELKQRLNNTEKLLKEKGEQSTEKNNNNNENSKIAELLQKFDSFKTQVDNELSELKRQKSFYEENYGKLFNIVVQNKDKENIDPKNQTSGKIETTTQTDKVLYVENVQHKNVVEVQEQSDQVNQEEQNIVEAKISATLAGIEGQMQAFWNKLSEIEQNKTVKEVVEVKEVIKPKAKPRSKLTKQTQNSASIDGNIEIKETLKNAIKDLEDEKKKEETVIKVKEDVKQGKLLKRAQSMIIEKVSSEDSESEEESLQSETESEVSESEESEEVPMKKPSSEVLVRESRSKLVKHVDVRTPGDSPSSAKLREQVEEKSKSIKLGKSTHHESRTPRHSPSSSAKFREKVKEKLELINLEKSTHESRKSSSYKSTIDINKQVEDTVYHRLQELGISENWKGLPQRSYDRAMEIINHQATLTKKAFPNFTSIKRKINKIIAKQCNEKLNNMSQLEVKTPQAKSSIEKLQNIVKIAYRPKSGRKQSSQRNSPKLKSPKRQINPALYDTDTESDNETYIKPHQLYSNVVEELKSLPKKPATDEESLDEAKKGVLKSFPSVASLSKKKVLFDLESDSTRLQEVVLQKQAGGTGGSTTSVASSILGEKVTDTTTQDFADKEKLSSKVVEKDLNYLSDFDLSDLE